MGKCLKKLLSLFFVYAVFSQSSIYGEGFFSAKDREIAQAYIKQAQEISSQGDIKGAKELLLSSLQFMPDSSDALYLLSEITAKDRQGTYVAIKEAEDALKYDNWEIIKKEVCRDFLSGIYLRIGEYKRALQITEETAKEGWGTANSEYIRVLALLMTGKLEESAKLLDIEIKNFPGDPRFEILMAGLSPTYRKSLITEYLTGKNPYENNETVLLSLVKREDTSYEEKKELLDLYFKNGGTSFYGYLEKIRIELIASEGMNPEKGESDQLEIIKVDINKFVAKGGFQDSLAQEALWNLLEKYGYAEEYLYGRGREFSGKNGLDRNGDGFFETLYTYDKGFPLSLIVDRNQDGIPEYEIQFRNGVPDTVAEYWNNNLVTIKYGKYPMMESLTVETPEKRTIYTFIPGLKEYEAINREYVRLVGSLAAPPGLFNKPYINDPLPPISEEILKNGVKTIRENSLIDTDRILVWDSIPGDSSWNLTDYDSAGRILKKVIYKRGLPVTGWVDTDKDGSFETSLLFSGGNLSQINFGIERSSTPEFSISLQGGYSRYWDFNEDGIIDCREKIFEDGTIRRDFSREMDGEFDTTIDYKDGLITAVMESGLRKEVTLVMNQNEPGKYYWIGPPVPGKLPTEIPKAGTFTFRGKKIAVFTQLSYIYLEAIE